MAFQNCPVIQFKVRLGNIKMLISIFDFFPAIPVSLNTLLYILFTLIVYDLKISVYILQKQCHLHNRMQKQLLKSELKPIYLPTIN